MLLAKVIAIILLNLLPSTMVFKSFIDFFEDGEGLAIIPLAYNMAIIIVITILVIKV